MSKSVRKVKREDQWKHTRVIDTLTGPLERRSLAWMAAHLPLWVTPDNLTVVGVVASIIIGVSYLLSGAQPLFLWLACAGFVLNWFGDSMDGTLARFRHIERPRYGFFVDHIMDAICLVLLFFCLGTTPYVRFEIATVTMVGYLLLEIYTVLSTYTSGEFKISYLYLGPTEMRLLAILASILVYFNGTRFIHLFVLDVTYYELILLGLILLFYGGFFSATFFRIRQLSRAEPASQVTRPPNTKKSRVADTRQAKTEGD
jgi:archaetidylinositol phosphate synthase